jgi:hypothetical protein
MLHKCKIYKVFHINVDLIHYLQMQIFNLFLTPKTSLCNLFF